jgi:hypothetical protein
MTRYNTTKGAYEYYDADAWETPLLSATGTGLDTAGRVFFADANGRAAGSSNLFWDATNSRLGIGTTTPEAPLSVRGTGAPFFRAQGTLTNTASGIALGVNVTNTLSPTANSATIFRVFNIQNLISSANISYTASQGVTAGWFENRITAASSITSANGGYFYGALLSSSSTQNPSIASTRAIQASGYHNLSSLSANAVTDVIGVSINTVETKGTSVITNNAAIVSESNTDATNNSQIVLGQTTIPTGNWGIYNAESYNNYFNGNIGVKTTSPLNTLQIAGTLGRKAPVTVTATPYTLLADDTWVIVNRAATTTINLPAASSWTGRELTIKTIQAQTVISNASNVVPIDGDAAGTAILPATDGAWALLVSNGTNWVIMQRG